jgi:hypothetical protein
MLTNKKDRKDHMMLSTEQDAELIFTGLADERGLYKLSSKQRPGLLLTGEEDREDYGVSSRPDRGWGGGPPPPPSPRHLGGGGLQGHAYRRLSGGLPLGFETRGLRSSHSTGFCSVSLRN